MPQKHDLGYKKRHDAAYGDKSGKKAKEKEKRARRVADRDAHAEREFWANERTRRPWPLRPGTRVIHTRVRKLTGTVAGDRGPTYARAYTIRWDRPHLADRHLGFDSIYVSPADITT